MALHAERQEMKLAKTLVALIIIAYAVACPAAVKSESSVPASPIRIYDLRYTLNIDISKPEQVRMAWDHCHAVSALQGLVNRREPLLYIRFVDSQHRKANVDDYWLEKLSAPRPWVHGRGRQEVGNIVELVG